MDGLDAHDDVVSVASLRDLDIASCAPIAGETARTYVPGPADSGFRLRARVTATNSAGSGVATSEATEPF